MGDIFVLKNVFFLKKIFSLNFLLVKKRRILPNIFFSIFLQFFTINISQLKIISLAILGNKKFCFEKISVLSKLQTD